jgi:hypothetical protein
VQTLKVGEGADNSVAEPGGLYLRYRNQRAKHDRLADSYAPEHEGEMLFLLKTKEQ